LEICIIAQESLIKKINIIIRNKQEFIGLLLFFVKIKTINNFYAIIMAKRGSE
jgi:hypothetical protein